MTSSERGGADDITENLKENEGTRLKSDGERGCSMQQRKCVKRPWAVANAWFETAGIDATQAGPRGRGRRTLPTQASWWLVALNCSVRGLAADRNRNPETMTQSPGALPEQIHDTDSRLCYAITMQRTQHGVT